MVLQGRHLPTAPAWVTVAHGAQHSGVVGTNTLGLRSGIARLNPDGTGAWIAASTAAGDPSITQVANNAAPVLSADGRTLYVAVLDPNTPMLDLFSGAIVMASVLAVDAPTRPRSAASTTRPDPVSAAVLIHRADGNLHRWRLATDILTQSVPLTAGLEETYTPTLVGPDGTVYVIKDDTLCAVGASRLHRPALQPLGNSVPAHHHPVVPGPGPRPPDVLLQRPGPAGGRRRRGRADPRPHGVNGPTAQARTSRSREFFWPVT